MRWLAPGVVALILPAALPACAGVGVRPATSASLDGWYATLGPVGAAVRIEDAWASGVGLEASAVRIREGRIPAALGLAAGGFPYEGREGGRLWLEAEAALKRPLPFGVGLGVGPTLELDAVRPPRPGAQATLWVFAGVIPYLRAGWLAGEGAFTEVGLMIKLPAIRFAN